MSDDLGYVVLEDDEVLTYQSRPRETSAMWRDVTEGKRVFLPEYKPNQLGYWYRKALQAGFKLTMKRAQRQGVWGTEMQRAFDGDGK